jgi:hypothetical protein
MIARISCYGNPTRRAAHAAQRPRAKLPGGSAQVATHSRAHRRARCPNLPASPPGQLQRVVGRRANSALSLCDPSRAPPRETRPISCRCYRRPMDPGGSLRTTPPLQSLPLPRGAPSRIETRSAT